MNQHAEYVSPGTSRPPGRCDFGIHRYRRCSAKARRVGRVEASVHADCVFVDGRIAAGPQSVDIEKIVRDVYRAAGYGGSWNPDPEKIRVTTELCEEILPAENRISGPSPMTRTSSSATRAATTEPRPPAAHWISGELGRRLFARLRTDPDLSATFGPDFKILSSLERRARRNPGRMGPPDPEYPAHSETALRAAAPDPLASARAHPEGLGSRRARGSKASTFTPNKLILNGQGEFAIGGPEGDNGLSGKKLVIDHYGPGVPIGGGAFSGKDPHKVDKCGALRARQLAKRLVRNEASTRPA